MCTVIVILNVRRHKAAPRNSSCNRERHRISFWLAIERALGFAADFNVTRCNVLVFRTLCLHVNQLNKHIAATPLTRHRPSSVFYWPSALHRLMSLAVVWAEFGWPDIK